MTFGFCARGFRLSTLRTKPVSAKYLNTDAQNSPSKSGSEGKKFWTWHIRSLMQYTQSHTAFFYRTTRQCSNIEMSICTPLTYIFEDFSGTFLMNRPITRIYVGDSSLLECFVLSSYRRFESTMILRNVGRYSPNETAWLPRRLNTAAFFGGFLVHAICLLPYLLTYSMEQSPSWEANWFCS